MNIKKIAYDLYKIYWVNIHISLERQFRVYREYVIAKELNYDEKYTFDDFLFDNGYDNELYVCEDEFYEIEYLDENYMENLIPHNSVLWKEYQKDIQYNMRQEENFMDKEKIIKEILKLLEENDMEMTVENFVENCVGYALENSHCRMNWIAKEFLEADCLSLVKSTEDNIKTLLCGNDTVIVTEKCGRGNVCNQVTVYPRYTGRLERRS